MTETFPQDPVPTGKRLAYGFIAGFIATIVGHQPVLALLAGLDVAPFGAFNMGPTAPFGVPVMFSLAFWGGVWGLLFALLIPRPRPGAGYWIGGFLFGALLTSAVALLVVVPLKGGPVGAGWAPNILLTAFIINGVWGLLTALLYWLFGARSRRLSHPGL